MVYHHWKHCVRVDDFFDNLNIKPRLTQSKMFACVVLVMFARGVVLLLLLLLLLQLEYIGGGGGGGSDEKTNAFGASFIRAWSRFLIS